MTVQPLAAVTPAAFPFDLAGWERWLSDRIDHDWRPSEWQSDIWLFTGDVTNSRTSVWKCPVDSCRNVHHSKTSMCRTCFYAFKASGLAKKEFQRTFQAHQGVKKETAKPWCLVEKTGVRCSRPGEARGLCKNHYSQWYFKQKKRQPLTLEEWVAAAWAAPYTDDRECLVPGCERWAVNARQLCGTHLPEWYASGTRDVRLSPEDWAQAQIPRLGGAKFSLLPLLPLVRLEVLFGLQRRDTMGSPLSPKSMRRLVKELAHTTTLLHMDETMATAAREEDKPPYPTLRQILWSVRNGWDEFTGVSAADKDVLDLRALELKSSKSRSGRRFNPGTVDLSAIAQEWLRELVRQWIINMLPEGHEVRFCVRAATLASDALNLRPSGGQDTAALQFVDMNAIADAFRTANRLDGLPYSQQNRSALLGAFFKLMDFGRNAEILGAMPAGFARHSSHTVPREDPNEDAVGSALPEHVIGQLDAHIDKLGEGIPFGDYTPDQVHALFKTIYIVLRDTGRRPIEVASLRTDCLETIDGETSLIWDNGKGKRNRRRLPIATGTAQGIQDWQAQRPGLPAHPRSDAYLFPAITEVAGIPHIFPTLIATAIRLWAQSIPDLRDEALGPDGEPLQFDRSRITPYAFRHSYAQRHADAGTPVDVLRELMDHVSTDTTMGYFQVSLKRKRAAVKTLAALAVDRTGSPAPFASGLAYQRSSVAVPFGGCVEPSNVKAGGHACPIRFQCAGCPFYRPDPSYLPAIEQQINDLKADRESAEAMDAAEYVVRNLSEQVDAYAEVAATMRQRLADLPADERAEIEEASAIMRRARATTTHRLLPLTVTAGTNRADGAA